MAEAAFKTGKSRLKTGIFAESQKDGVSWVRIPLLLVALDGPAI